MRKNLAIFLTTDLKPFRSKNPSAELAAVEFQAVIKVGGEYFRFNSNFGVISTPLRGIFGLFKGYFRGI
jgi:hypothetical protein